MENNINFISELMINEFKKLKDEKQKLINTCKDMVNYYQEKIHTYMEEVEVKEEQLKNELLAMIPDGEYKETKTQLSYCTPSAKVIKKKIEKNYYIER